jgi:hypothetical protein
MGMWLSPPLPASPARGEVPHRAIGTICFEAPAQHLPPCGGGWEGVLVGQEGSS